MKGIDDTVECKTMFLNLFFFFHCPPTSALRAKLFTDFIVLEMLAKEFTDGENVFLIKPQLERE